MKITKRQHGFSLLELMMTVAIAGILAALSVVLYQRYTMRATGVDVIEKYEEARTQAALLLAEETSEDCGELLRKLSEKPLLDDYATLAYGFEAADNGGYRPVMTVCASVAAHGNLGVGVARGAYETLAKTGSVEAGAVITESIVSFSLALSDGSESRCQVMAQASAAPACSPLAVSAQAPIPKAPSPAEIESAKAAAVAPFDPAAASIPPDVKPVSPTAPSCPAGQEFAAVTAQGKTQRACAPICSVNQIRTPTGQCIADVPPLQPDWLAQAEPPTELHAVSAPQPPADDPLALPDCGSGQELVSTMIRGEAQDICVESCPQGKTRGPNWSCVEDPNACRDTFLGNCSIDFNGMCDEQFVQDVCPKYCGLCKDDGTRVTRLTPGTPEETAPLAPTTASLIGMAPKTLGETVVLDNDMLVRMLHVRSPDGKTPVQVTNIDFTPYGYSATQQSDGRWRITRTGTDVHDFFDARITVDNGMGYNRLEASWFQ